MATIKCFSIGGIEMWIPSGDHEPPHFHARRPDKWYIKVWFLKSENEMIEILKGKIFQKDKKAVCDNVKLYREELLKEWEKCSGA